MRLNRQQRTSARNLILQTTRQMLYHAPAIHYTQGARRWDGINKGLRAVKGEYPKYADCSSMATWVLWNALTHALHDLSIQDVCNGEHWHAGYTGTLSQHGTKPRNPGLVGDLYFYGHGWPYGHVAVSIGGGYVFSHGSESGPYKLRWNYRSDFATVRRFILRP